MKKIIHVVLFGLFCTVEIFAQGGGPPMITDDPGTPDVGSWELNFSFNSDIKTNEKEFEAPLLDINYGYNERTQLKIEFPYLFSKMYNEELKSQLGDVKSGIKYRFFDEEKFPFSMSIYPQLEISTENLGYEEFLFPVQFEKSFGRVVFGAELGYGYLKNNLDYFQNGILLGYGFSENFEIMSEVNLYVNGETLEEIEGTFNFGLRYEINESVKIILSFGTGIIAPETDLKTKFISFVGMQLNL